MKCPACKTEDHDVLETRVVSDLVTRRRHECVDGHRWSTYERVDMATLDATRSVRQPLPVASPTTTRSVRSKALETTTRSVQTLPVAFAAPFTGGRGGSVQGSSLPVSAPSEPLGQTRPRVKLKPEIKYPPEFEAQWNATAKTGSKANALNEWESFGRPVFGASWAKWARLDSWRRGFVPHVATWLHDRRFQQEPAEPRKVASNAPTPRSGDPTPIRDVAAATTARLAAQRNVTPATPEQLAELRGAK